MASVAVRLAALSVALLGYHVALVGRVVAQEKMIHRAAVRPVAFVAYENVGRQRSSDQHPGEPVDHPNFSLETHLAVAFFATVSLPQHAAGFRVKFALGRYALDRCVTLCF
jgi:hypothetical protein